MILLDKGHEPIPNCNLMQRSINFLFNSDSLTSTSGNNASEKDGLSSKYAAYQTISDNTYKFRISIHSYLTPVKVGLRNTIA